MAIRDVTAQFPIPVVWPRLPMTLSKVDAVVIHHTVTLFLSPTATVQDELNQIAVIHKYHQSLGWGGFAYHLITFPSGRVYLVTPLAQWGAHVAGNNDHLHSVAFAGNFASSLPGAPQIAGGAEGVAFCWAALRRRVPSRPHNYYVSTTCPGQVPVQIVHNKAIELSAPAPTPTPQPTPAPTPPPVEEEIDMPKPAFIRVKGTKTVYLVEKDRLVHAVNPTHWGLIRGEDYELKEVAATDTILDIPAVYPLGVPKALRAG